MNIKRCFTRIAVTVLTGLPALQVGAATVSLPSPNPLSAEQTLGGAWPAATPAFSLAGLTEAALPREHAQLLLTRSAATAPSATLAQLELWNFVTTIRAQQSAQYFDLTHAQLTTIDYAQRSVSAVPLPASAWLFVVGVLGVCGSSLSLGRRAVRRAGLASESAPITA